MDETRISRFREDLLVWADDNLRQFPWRDPDKSLYQVFVAEFFLTQTPAGNVAEVYPDFVERFSSLPDIEETSEEELVESITPLGFQNMRAEALKAIASENSSLPTDVGGLRNLPRVGSYVANATLCFASDEPLPILDRNVERIYERVFGDEWPRTPSENEDVARELLPAERVRTYNLALLDFGSEVCASEPQCSDCFAKEYCSYYRELDEERK